MENKSLKTLEYNKIIEMLTEHAGSLPAKKLCKELSPSSDINVINRMQQETSDALSRISRFGSVSFYGLSEIEAQMKRLEVGSSLGAGELLMIASNLRLSLMAKNYDFKMEDEKDSLSETFLAISPLSPVKSEIERCILADDEIADDASPALKDIRRKIRVSGDRIHSYLNELISSQSKKTYLRDSLITMRDGRYCVPVKVEHKANVPGIVHDQSSSGSTLFVEPAAVVELNNKLTSLRREEAEEIQAILSNLSNMCGEHIYEIRIDYECLVKLDFIFARASLARDMNAVKPAFNDEQKLNLKGARHPLLNKETCVPINVYLGDSFNLLVITGPNTGGKTISLKTVGLLSLMAQSGLHIPANEGSSLCIFDNVFADIGDEQSIEQSLSTFSSHMVNIVEILKVATSKSLCLFDEIGAGTDPEEGAALGIAILSELKDRGTRIIATTHYSELKLFALETPGVENASCEFDVASLRPTYRLLIGILGKSNAFAISKKLGLPDRIIDKADSMISNENRHFEDVLAEIEKQRQLLEKEKDEVAVYKSHIESLKRDYEKRIEKVDTSRDKIIERAKEEASEILKEAKDTADSAIREIHKQSKGGDNKKMEAARSKVGEALKKNRKTSDIKQTKQKKDYKPSDFTPGTAVKVLSMGINGYISDNPKSNGTVQVRMGILNSMVKLSDLEIIDEPEVKTPQSARVISSGIKIDKAMNIKTEINLIGMTADEAISELEKYLDDAYISGLHQVTIIHGKGTGILRNAVRNYLKKCNYVDSYRQGAQGEGDAGATIVTFK